MKSFVSKRGSKMRVIAGKYKRTNLLSLEGDHTRPTKDMVKEALFSSIDVWNASFLDLFSGSGAMAIEALSRGADVVVLNDHHKKAVQIIKENLKKVNEKATVYNLDYAECLKALKGQQFDYIFIDPPYIFDEYIKLFSLVQEYNLLKKDAMMIWESHKTSDIKAPEGFECIKEKTYGITKIQYFKENNL